MKRKILFTLLLALFLLAPSSQGSVMLIPNIENPQDAVDVAVLIPEAGVRLAMIGYNKGLGTSKFAIITGSDVSYEYRDDVREGVDLHLIPDCMTAVVETISTGITLAISCSHPYVVLVANSVDYNLSMGFVDYLEDMGVEVLRASAIDFDGYKDAETIIILGGPDALEGMGNITAQVLDEDEESFLRVQGNQGMFIHDNPWHPGSGGTVAVLAGSDRYETQRAALENKEKVIV